MITRERLRDGSHLAAIRARATPDFPIRSDAEIEASLAETLAGHPPGEDVWVFGYGSLMWNPAFRFEERRLGTVRGWHRRFCLWLSRGRGSPDCPGLMLALDRGGTCRGVAFRIPAAEAREELLLVWRREMLSGAYLARWVTVATEEGPVRAVTFVVNQGHKRYSGKLGEAETAERILAASGELGSCLDYFERTVRILRTLQVRDAALERLETEIERRSGRSA
ncbi:gamma-glutamylcyclotransferase [Enterovirga sp. DB1703]|uniref:glutathione-specific gamma-glutamylcyclotransferase n=1 Tax=Enterovirga aerilata TaxID=2730920 RepID=A0A849HUN3_9HYPH|nr:gamma-glutamylcyclotransferase [Enterovirga sp. DB1703]